MKTLSKINLYESSKFSNNRKLIHRLRSPRIKAFIDVLPWTLNAPLFSMFLFVCRSRQLTYPVVLSIGSFFRLYLVHVLIHLLLFPKHGTMPNRPHLEFLSPYINLTSKVLVARYHCLCVDIDSIYIQHHLVLTIGFCLSAVCPY